MLPQNEDPWWRIAEWIVGGLAATVAALTGVAWTTKPNRAEVQKMLDDQLEAHRETDARDDLAMVEPLIREQTNLRAEVMRMHGENRECLRDIAAKLDRLIESLGYRERGH